METKQFGSIEHDSDNHLGCDVRLIVPLFVFTEAEAAFLRQW